MPAASGSVPWTFGKALGRASDSNPGQVGGHGYCRHDSLRRYDARTASLVQEIEDRLAVKTFPPLPRHRAIFHFTLVKRAIRLRER